MFIEYYDKLSSLRRYSPISDWWKATIIPGSARRQSCTDLAATPKPYYNNNKNNNNAPDKDKTIKTTKTTITNHNNNKFKTKQNNIYGWRWLVTDENTYQWYVAHRIHDNSLILLRILRDSSQTRLSNMITVQEGLLGTRLQPHLTLHITSGRKKILIKTKDLKKSNTTTWINLT